MRAKSVNEFKQGGNPYDIMGLGAYKNPKVNDAIRLNRPIYRGDQYGNPDYEWRFNVGVWNPRPNDEEQCFFPAGTILYYHESSLYTDPTRIELDPAHYTEWDQPFYGMYKDFFEDGIKNGDFTFLPNYWKKSINEFKQNLNPYDAMDLGPNRASTYPRKYDELPDNIKEIAFENFRESERDKLDMMPEILYDYDSFLEPKHKRLNDLFGKRYTDLTEPMIGCNGEVYFDLDKKSIDISKAIEVNDEQLFNEWLGIEEIEHKIFFTILADSIQFYRDEKLDDSEELILRDATHIFEKHISDVLQNISDEYEYRTSDEYITEEIDCHEILFDKEGNIV
jgi:hypothetical protein